MSDVSEFCNFDEVLKLCTRDRFSDTAPIETTTDESELSFFAEDYYVQQEFINEQDLDYKGSDGDGDGLFDNDSFMASICHNLSKDAELFIDTSYRIHENCMPAAASCAAQLERPAASKSVIPIKSDPMLNCLQSEIREVLPSVSNERPCAIEMPTSCSDLESSLSQLFSNVEPLPVVDEPTGSKPTLANSQRNNNVTVSAAMASEPVAARHRTRTADVVIRKKLVSPIGIELKSQHKCLLEKLALPADYPLEFVNSGFGIVNPMYERNRRYRARYTEGTGLRCPLCNKDFTVAGQLNRHVARHSADKRYMCVFCIKSFHDLFDLKRHSRTHTGIRPYKCDLCGNTFTQLNSMEQHKRLKHGISHHYDYMERRSKRFICEECGEQNFNAKAHKLHLQRKHPLSCVLGNLKGTKLFNGM